MTVSTALDHLKVRVLRCGIYKSLIPFRDVKDNQPGVSFQVFGFSVTDKILKYHDETTRLVFSQ